MYTIYGFLQFDEEHLITGKIENCVKKFDFWLDFHEICGCHGNVKNHGHKIDIHKFPRKMNKQLSKVSAS